LAKLYELNINLTIIVIFTLLIGIILPVVTADTSMLYVDGFEKGISWKPYISLKRTTFVNFDEESYTDDYAYLASVPTAVFYDKNTDQIFTNPLLFYQEKNQNVKHKERSLNAYQGIDYFMEDWLNYSNGHLDQLTLINIKKNKLNSDWRANNYTSIDSTDPSNIASQIALNDWSFANDAVIAVIAEKPVEKPNNRTEGIKKGTVSNQKILSYHFKVPQTNEKYPIYNDFDVPDGYKFLKVRSWYPCFYINAGIAGFEGIINMSIPAGDRDLQVYCEHNGMWMMALMKLFIVI